MSYLKWDLGQIGAVISIIVVFIVAVSIVRVAVYTMSAQTRLQNQASISYPEGMSLNRESFDWGEIGAGQSVTLNLTITNLLPYPATFSFYTANFEPANISEWLTLKWDYTNGTIVSQKDVFTEWTLSVDPLIPIGFGNFTFDVFLNSREEGAIMP